MQCSNTHHNQWHYILAEDDIEELQASWTVGCHFVGECNLQLYLRVVALDRRHDLCDVIGEAVREEQDHSVESTHVTYEALVVFEQPTAQPAALDGRRVRDIVLEEGTVWTIAQRYKVGAQMNDPAGFATFIGDVGWARMRLRRWSATLGSCFGFARRNAFTFPNRHLSHFLSWGLYK